MRTLDRRLVRNIRRSWLQFAAVTVVIAMGIASFIIMSNTAQNFGHSVHEYYRNQVFAHLFAEFAPQAGAEIERLDHLPEIDAVQGRIVRDVGVDMEDLHPTLRLVGLPEEPGINIPYVHDGRLPDRPGRRQVALLARFAHAHGLSVGDEIDLVIDGEMVAFTISGLVDSPEFTYAVPDIQTMMPDDEIFGVGFAHQDLLGDLLGMPGQVNDAVFRVSDGVEHEEARDRVEEELEGRGLRSVITREDQLSHFMVDIELESIEQVSLMIPVVFLGIAAAVIYMLIMRLVEADRTVIGVLKAMGYDNRAILGHYLKYALAMGAVGAGAGMAVGHIVVPYLTGLLMEFFAVPLMELRTDWSLLLWGILLTLVFCGGTALWAARGVLGIVPADAMRPEAPPPGRKNLLEVFLPGLWERISFSWKLVLRQILRNKKRFALSVMGVAFTFVVVLMPFYMLSVIDVMFIQQFGEFEVYDYSINFHEPVGPEGVEQLGDLVDYDFMEPFAEYPFRATHGWREETAVVRGLIRGSQLQRFENARGQRIAVPASGALVSRHLADNLGVGAGDELVLSSYAREEEERTLPVAAVVSQYLGSGIYVSLDQMDRLLRTPSTYTGVLMQGGGNVRGELAKVGNVSSVFSSTDVQDAFSEYMDMMVAMYSLMVIIGGVLGFAILFNTTAVSISERTREFASMRVLGYGRDQVYEVLRRENILASILGLLLGIPLGRVLTLGVSQAFQTDLFYLPEVFHPASYAVTTVLVVIYILIVMYAVRARVRSLNLLEALSTRMT